MYNVVAAKLTKTILLNEKQNYGGYFSISIHIHTIPYSTIFTVALTQSKKNASCFIQALLHVIQNYLFTYKFRRI